MNDTTPYLAVAADGSALVAYDDADGHVEVRRYTPGGGWGAATDFGDGSVRIATNATGGGMVFVQSGNPTFAAYRLILGTAPGWCTSPPWCELPDPSGGTIFASALVLADDGSAILVVMEGGVGPTAKHYTPHPTEMDAGMWSSSGVLSGVLEAVQQLQIGMAADGDAVATWRKSDLSGGLRYTRFTPGESWSAVGTIAGIADASSSRLAVGSDGTAVVLSASGKLLRAVRLP